MSNLFSLSGKHALVCGASQGIGRATALTLARMGARVSLLARSEASLVSLSEEIKKEGHSVGEIVAVDLEKHEELKSQIDRLIVTKGAVHILINNAGGPPPGPLLKATAQDFLPALSRHLFASQILVQTVLPGMQSEGYGRIINIISTSVKEPIPNLGVSNVIRGAMASWSKTLASELPPGVTINNVLPGFTKTPRLQSLRKNTAQSRGTSEEHIEKEWLQSIPEGRLAEPFETAAAISFLASPAGSYIRGQSLTVDGGRTRSL